MTPAVPAPKTANFNAASLLVRRLRRIPAKA
jgi:hypothetical protein